MTSTRRIFIKQIGLSAVGLGLISTIPSAYSNSIRAGRQDLPRSTPEAQGISSADIARFFDEVEKSKIEFHSIMIVCHGHVIAEGWWAPYAAPLKHTLYSLSKSFTSTAVGLAVSEGKLTVDDTIVSLFPKDLPKEISPNLAAMKVKHLLTMSTGHAKDTINSMRDAASTDSWAKLFLAQPVEFEPGTHFVYNTGSTYMQSAIVQKLTKQTLQQYLRPILFDPLGIEGEDWETDPQGINTGGYGLRVRTEDIAKFGQLYLQKGMWNGKQLIPANWVEEATKKQVESGPSNPAQNNSESDWSQGYGYQFWRSKPGGFRADGAFGQLSIVNPDRDMVVAVTEESFDMQASMRLIWNHLFPVVKKSAVTVSRDSQKKLKEKLKNLALNFPKHSASSPTTARISEKEFTLDANEFKAKSVSFRFNDSTCVLSLNDEKGERQTIFGLNSWVVDKKEKPGIDFPFPRVINIPTRIAGSATWRDNNTLLLTRRLIETAHSDTFTCIFDGDKVTIKFLNSLAAGNPNSPEKRADLQGRIVM